MLACMLWCQSGLMSPVSLPVRFFYCLEGIITHLKGSFRRLDLSACVWVCNPLETPGPDKIYACIKLCLLAGFEGSQRECAQL